MKMVLDTNVLLAAFITHGSCNELLEYCAVNHQVILSAFILAEIRERLMGKFGFSASEAEEVVDLLTSRCAVVKPMPLAERICRDPDDDPVIGTALAGDCRCIVTGDKDLLTLRQVKGIRMIAPADFWRVEEEVEQDKKGLTGLSKMV